MSDIEDDISSFVFEDNQDTDNTDTQMINVDTEIGNSDTPMEITKPQNNVVCLIDD